MPEGKTLDLEAINKRIEEENAQNESNLFNYLDSFKQENPALSNACRKVADQMKEAREAEEAADVAKAQEEAAAKVSAEYRSKYGESTQEVNKGYKELLKGLL